MARGLPRASEQAMSRDVTKLRVFHTAHRFLIDVYHATAAFPADERYGLRSQLRRAALSVSVNIVEGAARRTLREYVSFLNVAAASSAEVMYLFSVAGRSGYVGARDAGRLEASFRELLKSLRALLRGLETRVRSRPDR